MQRRSHALLFLLIGVGFSPSANAQEECIALLQHGLYDTYAQSGFNQKSSVLFSKVCEAYSEQKKAGGFLGLNLGDIGINLGGESLKEIGRMMCDVDYKTEDAIAKQSFFKRILNQTALDVFDNCVQNTRDGLQVKTTRPDDDTLVISVRYASPSPARLVRNGFVMTSPSFACSGSLLELARRGGKLESSRSYQATCHRADIFNPARIVAGRHIYHAGGTFTIDTNAGTIVRYLGPKLAISEKFETRLEAAEDALAKLDARLKAQRSAESFSCRLTDWLNSFDNNLNIQCEADEVLHGLYSDHNNHHEDRVFKFYCCKIRLRAES